MEGSVIYNDGIVMRMCCVQVMYILHTLELFAFLFAEGTTVNAHAV